MTYEEFQTPFLAMVEMRRLDVSPEASALWFDCVKDLPADAFRLGITRFMRESREFPTPAAVRELCGSNGAGDESRIRIAWAAVVKAIHQHGGYASVDFDDPLINATIRQRGGWNKLCEKTSDEMKWEEKEFAKDYRSISHTGIGDGSSLAGIIERENRSGGYLAVSDLTGEPSPRLLPSVSIKTGLPHHPVARRLSSPGNGPRITQETRRAIEQIGEMP